MEYSVQALAEMSGVTTRTLRWYDKVGLLRPSRVNDRGYRFYTSIDADRLQHILFYKEMGMELEQIRLLLDDPEFDRLQALRGHLADLEQKESKITEMIRCVKENIFAEERSIAMRDQDKFKAFKVKLVEENERRYGGELRKKYGAQAVDGYHEAILSMTEEGMEQQEEVERQLQGILEQAAKEGADPAGPMGEQAANLHRIWLSCVQKGSYTTAMHQGIAELYVVDPRFTAYYDKKETGCARFLRDAVHHWIKE